MNHFKRKFIQSLSDFSATERAKYPNPIKPVSKGRLFSDESLRKNFISPHGEYCEVDSSINRETQRIESWLEKVPKSLKSHEAYGALESFADAIKVLLSVEDNQFDLSMLLMLAGHPSCNLTALHSFGQSFDFGWGQAVDVALEMYLFVNVAGNTPGLLDDGKYARMKGFQDSVVYQIQQGYGRALEPHKLFWEAKLRPGDPFCGKDGKSGGGGNGYFPIMTVGFFEDVAYLKEYLKVCWRLLYKADMLMKECGVERKWDAKIVRALRRWGFEGKYRGKYREEWWANYNVEGRNGEWIVGIPNDFGSMQREENKKQLHHCTSAIRNRTQYN